MWVLTELAPRFQIAKLQLIHMAPFGAMFVCFLFYFIFTKTRKIFEAGEG